MVKRRGLIDVVIVVYNRREIVFEALPMLLDCPLIEKVIVVDNASSDGLRIEGPERFPEVDWVLLARNEGCTAWNRGMVEARSTLALILDDDCVPDIPSMYAATEMMRKTHSVGLAVFNIINQFSGLSEWGALEKVDGSAGWPNAIGACMLVRVEAFLKVGGYKNFFLCFNDLDLVLSMWELGYRVVYDERWTAIHKQEKIGARKRRIFFEVRNLLWTIWGHIRLVPGLLITVKFVSGALYDARGLAEYDMVVRAFGKGLVLGLRQRHRRTGQIPEYVLGLLYRNLLFSGRLSKGLMRISPRLFVALKP